MKRFAPLLRWTFKVVAIVILGGIGALILQNSVMPKLVTYPSLARYSLFRTASENTTIINKTEQVVVREDDSVEKVASQASAAVVTIVSVPSATDIVQRSALKGSGVLVTNDGLIATYRKALLEKDARYTVLLYNGLTYGAQLVSVDPLTNIAYLRIEASNVPAISFANSDDMRPGKKLIALANASQEYRNRFASTLLSDIDKTFNLSEKTLSSSEKWEGVFDIDLIHPEKYIGGPIINYNGEMVGLVGSAELDNQSQYFIIPANVVRRSLEMAIRGEFDKRPVLGVYYLSLDRENQIIMHASRDKGALIYAPSGKSGLAILSGSSAEKSGLRINDIVIAVNEQEIDLDNPLSVVLSRFSKGETVELSVLRNGEEKKIQVAL